ncbi:ALP1-like protein [Tanacetum coccineum]
MCTSAIRQLAYDIHADFLDEYLQMSERSSRLSLDHFCSSIVEIFRPEYLRKPTVTDVVNFIGLTKKTTGQHVRRDHGPNLFILVEAIASQELWIWHAFFGVAGYYLVDGIYLEWATLVKTIPEPADDDNKRILYNQKQESARKYVERAFGVLKKKWAILANPARALKKERIMNMISYNKKVAISTHGLINRRSWDVLTGTENVQAAQKYITGLDARRISKLSEYSDDSDDSEDDSASG